MVQTIKARTLYTKYEPALSYNDFSICGNNSSFKNGNPFGEILNFVNQTTNEFPDTNKFVGGVLNDDEFKLYPNPTDNELKLQYHFQDRKPRTFLIYDILGRQVLKQELNPLNPEVVINTSSLQVGVYTYIMHQLNGQRFFGKIIIAR